LITIASREELVQMLETISGKMNTESHEKEDPADAPVKPEDCLIVQQAKQA